MVLMRWSALSLVALVAHQARALMSNCPQCYAQRIDPNGGDHVQAYAEMEFTAGMVGCGNPANAPCESEGTMFMEQLDGITRMYGLFYNIPGGAHGHAAHVHQYPPKPGDDEATDGCSAAALGAIFDGPACPMVGGKPDASHAPCTGAMNHHASPYDAKRQLGDLGQFNVTQAGTVGTAQFMLFDDAIALSGSNNVEGMSINIHYDPEGDDYGKYVANPASDPTQVQMEGMSKATGMHSAWQDVPASGSTPALTNVKADWANSIGCGAITKLGTPTVKAKAHMSIDPTASNSGIHGTLTFEELDMPAGSHFATNLRSGDSHGTMTRITGVIYGLKDGEHGFHVHEMWNKGKTNCGDASGFIYDPDNLAQIPGGASAFNPAANVLPANKMAHGGPANAYTTESRMVGDLGNIWSEGGVAVIYIMDPSVQVSGSRSVIGHSIDIHPMMDTLAGPLPDVANAPNVLDKVGGDPVACGPIQTGGGGSSGSSKGGLSDGAIAGIIIGAMAVLGVGAFVVVRTSSANRQAQDEKNMRLMSEQGPGGHNL